MNLYDRNPAKPKFMITPTSITPMKIVHIDIIQAEGQQISEPY